MLLHKKLAECEIFDLHDFTQYEAKGKVVVAGCKFSSTGNVPSHFLTWKEQGSK